ncbi:MAG: N-6 DNA methylase [Azospirillum sp.]|nr:N-6 DNA methylase [Azospirillum sp.]
MTGSWQVLRLAEEHLGYSGDPGLVAAEHFDDLPSHRHALRLARDHMGVCAAFGLWTGAAGALRGAPARRFTPLVYLAQASDERLPKEIHKRVWSQGLVPHLLIAEPDCLWLCRGFEYPTTNWAGSVRQLPAVAGGNFAESVPELTARRLRTAIAWRDFSARESDFVDARLLNALAELAHDFTKERPDRPRLEPAAANALIARLLYFYFLVDRGFITEKRLQIWGVAEIGLDARSEWPVEATHRLFSQLDGVFNGSIFPMRDIHRPAITARHVNDLRQVLRFYGEPGHGGSLQLGLFECDFTSLRTETLSAIYEMFLRAEEKDGAKSVGAFYTPPFLVDYILDRIEDEKPLGSASRLLDPAAGSGVFLVGGYRRIVEAALPRGRQHMALATLKALMMGCIFGVEKNETACHVAAFSLYLTMLDYVDPVEAAEMVECRHPSTEPEGAKLFPPMLGEPGRPPNLTVGDFFEVPAGERFDAIVGNPPWVQLRNLESGAADDYLAKAQPTPPIGDNQAAELFAWRALKEFLAEDGLLGLLLPAKSLVNKASDDFNQSLRASAQLVGISDLSHLRYKLFRQPKTAEQRARHPAAAIILRNRVPEPDHQFWVYRPLRTGQPVDRKGLLWLLIHDWTQITWHLQTDVTARNWPHLFTCSPVDERVIDYIDRGIAGHKFLSIGDLESFGLKLANKVSNHVDRQYWLGTGKGEGQDWRLPVAGERLGGTPMMFAEMMLKPLPDSELRKATSEARPFLQGKIVVMPRDCTGARFITIPVVFSSSLIGACFPEYAGKDMPVQHLIFLQALAAYLESRLFKYLASLTGRNMMGDRRRLEVATLKDLPWPFQGPGDPRLAKFIGMTPDDRDRMVCDLLGIDDLFRSVISEFDEFRSRFRDGQAPEGATDTVGGEVEVAPYRKMLGAQINQDDDHRLIWRRLGNDDAGAMIIQYQGLGVSPESPDQALERAWQHYQRHTGSGVGQSRYLWHSQQRMESVLIKPLARMHWTQERAFADADAVLAAVMSGFDSERPA